MTFWVSYTQASSGTLLTEDDIQEGVNDMNQTAEYDRNGMHIGRVIIIYEF